MADTHAATFAVTNLNDSGAGSLRQAILDANSLPGDDAVIFQNSLNGTILLTSGELLVESNLTITGLGSNVLTVARDAQAAQNFRILNIPSAVSVSISGITISGGQLEPTTFGGRVSGAGIFNAGTLNLVDVKLIGNRILRTENIYQTSNSGGGIFNSGTLTIHSGVISGNQAGGWVTNSGGGIHSTGSLTLTNTIISGNQAFSADLGLTNSGPARGGGIFGDFTMVNSTVSGNTARGRSGFGGGIHGSGTMINSTVSGNSVSGSNFNGESAGGGMFGGGEIINSTFTYNGATNNGGSGSRGGAISTNSTGTSIKHSTIVHNGVTGTALIYGGGIYGGPTIHNTIIAQNTISATQPTQGGPNVSGDVTSQGNNLIDNTSGSSGWVSSDLVGQNPLLAPFGNYGGPTSTYALLPNSPAINGGNNSGATATDQRGATRIAGGTIDIGAFENVINVSPASLPGGIYQTPYNQTITANRLSSLIDESFLLSEQSFLSQLPPFAFSVLSGNVPNGILLSASGTLAGTPQNAGTFNFNVKATDADGMAGVRAYTLNIPCFYSINPTSLQIAAAGGSSSFVINTPSGCEWTAQSDSAFISVTSGGSGNGNGTINFSVAANSGPSRSGNISIGGQTLTINQASGCVYSLSAASVQMPSSSGNGGFNLTTVSGCQWTVASNNSWLTITSSGNGSGSGAVTFSVQANTGSARSGTIIAAGQTFTVNQASGCTYSLSNSNTNLPSSGGSGNVSITSGSGCAWSAVSNDAWITILSGSDGSGSGVVTFTVSSNPGPSRTGTITVAGQTFSVLQASGCTFTLAPAGTNFPSGGGSGSFNITTNNAGCAWSASTADSWISIVKGSSGTGNGSVSFSVQTNVSPARSGSIIVNGQIYSISQSSGCNYTLSAAGVNFPASGGNGSFSLNAGGGCLWTAVSNSPWIVVNSGDSGSGSGVVTFTIQPNTGASRNGAISVTGGQTFTINQAAVLSLRSFLDFDGDGKTDIGVFRPSDGSWWYTRSSASDSRVYPFGIGSDIITPGDYTGDGKADLGVFRPATGQWFVQRSEDNSYFSFPFGTNGDIPTPADYDNDGKTDVAVFRPSSGIWFILNSGGSGTTIIQFGLSEDKPVSADFDGDGKADIAVFRPSDGTWWYLQSSNSQTKVFRFGIGTDKPVQGDYTGDGKADIAVFRPSTGEWYVQRSEDNSYYSVPFGQTGDIPAPGDYDGDGKFDTAVFRPSTATWFVQRSAAGIFITGFGLNGDRPISNAFVR